MKFGCLLAVCSSCFAQDFYWTTASARSIGMGGTYVASRGGVVDALAANPAGISLISRPTADFVLTAIFSRGSFTNAANNSSPMTRSPGVVPFGAFGSPLGRSRFHAALGLIPELSAASEWRYRDAPGTAGASYGEQRQQSSIVAARIAGAVSYTVSDRLSFGLTIGRVYNSNRLNAPYIFQSHPALQGLKTLLDLQTNGYGWNTSAGVIAKPWRKVQLGFAWKSKTTIESTGSAVGNVGQQLAALGLVMQPDFRYDARVRNELPQSLLGHTALQVNTRLLVAGQFSWVNWKRSFVALPVSLTNGSNRDLNQLLASSGIEDRIPLQWKDRYSAHIGAEYSFAENWKLRTGFSHANNPVPSSTLSPLTAAIVKQQLASGVGWRQGHMRLDLAYSFGFLATASTAKSALLAGEYSNSRVRVGLQSVTLGSSYEF